MIQEISKRGSIWNIKCPKKAKRVPQKNCKKFVQNPQKFFTEDLCETVLKSYDLTSPRPEDKPRMVGRSHSPKKINLFNYQENIITNCNFNFSKIKDCDINYKKVHYYLKNFSLIKDNIFQSIQANQLKKSNHTITSLIVLQNGNIAVASHKQIIIFNKVQTKLILGGHTNNVSSLSLSDNDTIISCSIDGEIKI